QALWLLMRHRGARQRPGVRRPSAALPHLKRFSPSLATRPKALLSDAGTQNAVAARPNPSTRRTRRVFCDCSYLRKASPLSRRAEVARFASRAHGGDGGVWMAIGSVGCFLKSLPFCRPFACPSG